MTTEIGEKNLDEVNLNRIIDDKLILHTDLGSQYTKVLSMKKKLSGLNISHSYSRKADSMIMQELSLSTHY